MKRSNFMGVSALECVTGMRGRSRVLSRVTSPILVTREQSWLLREREVTDLFLLGGETIFFINIDRGKVVKHCAQQRSVVGRASATQMCVQPQPLASTARCCLFCPMPAQRGHPDDELARFANRAMNVGTSAAGIAS